MLASDARKLQIEDKVAIFCGTERKVGAVVEINWPRFKVALVDSRGRRFHRYRRYRSLRTVEIFDRIPPEFLKPNQLPTWLEFPALSEEYCIAADYCEDLGFEQAAIVLKDRRCNHRKLDSICYHRDRPNREQLLRAIEVLGDFPTAHSKLLLYVARLDELRYGPLIR